MNNTPSQEQLFTEFIHLFSDPASALSSSGKEGLVGQGLSAPLHLALWLEYFLVAGDKLVKEKWALLPLAEQTALGIELLKCYLFQPLYIRLSKEDKSVAVKSPLILESRGKFFQVEHGAGKDRGMELLYPLDHRRLWPELFGIFQEDFYSSEKVFKALEPGIILASFSRLEKIRSRAETLQAIFNKREPEEILASFEKEKKLDVELITFSPLTDTPTQTLDDIDPSERIEPVKSTLPAKEEGSLKAKPSPPKRKKKKKTSMDQMELF